MNIHIDENSKQPAYLQVYNLLKKEIVEGVYPYGTKLPSKRTIALDAGLSLITVEHTLSLLQEEGYIEPRERSGYFVIYREADFQGNQEVNIIQNSAIVPAPTQGSGAKGEFPFTVLSKTMRKVLADYGEEILRRSPNEGVLTLRTAIKNYLQRSRGISVTENQIIIGAGAEYLYGLIAELLGRDRIYAIEKPSYEKIKQVYEANGIFIEELPLEKKGISSENLRKSKASVLHVTPFNSFPTGISVNITKKNEYLNFANLRKGYIIEDNYDSELTVSSKPEDTLFSMTKNDNVLYINTFSKTIAPSLRTGYLLLPKTLVADYRERLGFYACTVPVFEQLVLAELLNSGDFERHINRIRRKKRKEL